MTEDSEPSGAVEAAERIAFLNAVDLSEGSGDVAVVLHPLATGGSLRIVTDRDVLLAAQETAFFTDDPAAETRLLLTSIAALSPPGTSMRSPFVDILRDGRLEQRFTCFRLHCSGRDDVDTLPHARNIDRLLEASRPVADRSDFIEGADEARTRYAALGDDPNVFFLADPDLPAAGDVVFEGAARLHFPVLIRPARRNAEDPIPTEDPELERRITDALARILPGDGSDYELGALRLDATEGPMPIYEKGKGAPVRIGDGWLDMPSRLYAVPSLPIRASRDYIERLRRSGVLSDLPDFSEGHEAFDQELARLVREATGSDCADCFEIRLQMTVAPRPELSEFRPTRYYLGWYEITGG